MNAKSKKTILISILVISFFSVGLNLQHKYRFSESSDRLGVARFLIYFQRFWYDVKFRLREPEMATGVMVAKIDDASLERFGRWPWNRSIYKEVLDYLYDLGADVVAFDAVFSEAEFQQRYVKEALVSQVHGRAASLEKDLALTPPQVEGLSANLPVIGDQIFASSVFEHPKTVLGYFWQENLGDCPLYDPQNKEDLEIADHPLTREEASNRGLIHVDALVDNLGALQSQGYVAKGESAFSVKNPHTQARLMYCPVVNRSALSADSKFQGYFNAISDSDGLFRRTPLMIGFASEIVPKGSRDFLPKEWFESATFFPSLSMRSVATLWDSPGFSVELGKNPDGNSIVKSVSILRPSPQPALRIETLPDGSLPLNFYGSQSDRPTPISDFSLANIEQNLKDKYEIPNRYGLPHEKPLAHQIIMIGPTALGVYDLRPSPVQGDAPGVYLHAAFASRLLEYAKDPSSQLAVRYSPLWLSQILLWVFGLGLAFLLAGSSALQGALATGGLLAVFLGADYYLFTSHAYALDSATVGLSMASVSLLVLAFKYFTEERERAFVKGAFEKYVSPDVVGDILKDPKKLNLGGQKKELTVFFSDIRGFTTISERMGAAELAKFMNEYLSPMTDVVLANRGTIDKYMGDAIMAIFGAPVEDKDHPKHAADAALEMMKKLEELKALWRTQGLPPIDIGIGINTGDMSVGNMGSSRIFSYTVMGDSVNLGSRLEGINKEYGTHIIVSEYTRTQLGADYLCRELDRVKVKGKQLPVTIFELVGKELTGEKAQLVQEFELNLKLYYEKKFTEARQGFEKLAALDKTSDIYQHRCDLWLENPPPEDWDGAWTMKTK